MVPDDDYDIMPRLSDGAIARPAPAAGLPERLVPSARSEPLSPSPDRLVRSGVSPGVRLLAAMRPWVDDPDSLPRYVAGYHPDWRDDTDHCYSLVFRAAIRAGLLTDKAARALMARVPVGDPAGFRRVMLPHGYRRVPVALEGDGVRLDAAAWPPGTLVSLDGGAHVMVATGRLDARGRHEVLSYKGGQAATPVWGDSLAMDDHPHLHVLTVEDELENLLRDDQDLTDVYVAVGEPPWARP